MNPEMKKLNREVQAINKKYAARNGIPTEQDKEMILGLLAAIIYCPHGWPCLTCENKATRVFAELAELWEKI